MFSSREDLMQNPWFKFVGLMNAQSKEIIMIPAIAFLPNLLRLFDIVIYQVFGEIFRCWRSVWLPVQANFQQIFRSFLYKKISKASRHCAYGTFIFV